MNNSIASSIKDNRNRGSVGNFLKEKITANASLAFVSAYFTIYAYEALKDNLENIDKLNFLFGEPTFVKSVDPNNGELRQYKIENDKIELKNRLKQKKIAKQCSKWIEKKVKIKSIKQSGLLHGKMYHITDSNKNESAVLGSSNFTSKGLGFAKNSNIELNLEIQDKRDIQDLKNWFYEVWEDNNLTEDVKPRVLKYLEQLYADNPPELLYFKTLYHLFEKYLDEKNSFDNIETQKQFTDTIIWQKLFEFQKDGVKSAINKISKHNGCIIADSVGLGKTFEALAIIKYFEQRNHRVLVLCPKKLRKNWTKYQDKNNSRTNPLAEDKLRFDVLSHTDLSREKGDVDGIDLANCYWENYDLLVIDESHNFRNNNTGRKGKLSRYEKLLNEVIKKGRKTKVLLLSATPVNNSLEDLRNQLYFITADTDNAFQYTLNIPSLRSLISRTKKEFIKWSLQDNKTQENLLSSLNADFFYLLDELTIARSRKHIQKYYKENLAQIGEFPQRHKPESIYSQIDMQEEFPSYDEINDRILEYRLSLFTPTKYLKDGCEYKYKSETDIAQFSQENREKFLIGMMKSNFLKRLESSVNSFRLTLGNTLDKMNTLKDKIKNLSEYDYDEDGIYDEDEQDDIPQIKEEFLIGKKLKYDLRDIKTDEWLLDIEKDENELRYLYDKALRITPDRDAKLQTLLKKIQNKIQNPTKNNLGHDNKKVIVFTAFSDTAKYIYESIKDTIKNKYSTNIALVTGTETETTYGKNDYEEILTNFSPISKDRNNEDEQIDILIATDCISEGQNLQDCDYLINYDIHWNPVRLIQRFGRIDRIGSYNSHIKMVNFWATEDLDKYIKLKRRVEDKMMLSDISATNADNILRPDEVADILKQDLKYRENQLKRMKEEILDLEDFDENASLTDFSFEDFRIELLHYIQKNKEKLKNLPIGVNAVTSRELRTQEKTTLFDEGVIFCLKQKNSSNLSNKINPLQPYFLVYITFNNEIKYTFVNSKKILEVYRALCLGQEVADGYLYELFDQQTDNGNHLEQFDDLLYSAISKIKERFETKAFSGLFSSRNFIMPNKENQINTIEDFELITWLVII